MPREYRAKARARGSGGGRARRRGAGCVKEKIATTIYCGAGRGADTLSEGLDGETLKRKMPWAECASRAKSAFFRVLTGDFAV